MFNTVFFPNSVPTPYCNASVSSLNASTCLFLVRITTYYLEDKMTSNVSDSERAHV